MAGKLALLCGLAASVSNTVEASFESAFGKGSVNLHMKLRELEHKHKANLKRKLESMTTTVALEKLRKHGNETVMELVQSALQQKQSRVATNLRASADPNSGYSGVDKAKEMLNEMIQETQAKYDLEIQTCCDYDQTQSGLIEQTRQDISNFNAEAAEARKEVLDAQDHIEICEKKLPELKDSLLVHNRECDKEIASLREQLAIIDEDLKVMGMILSMISCDKKDDGSASLLSFSNCVDGCGESFVSFEHADMQKAIAGLKHNATRELLLNSLSGAGEDVAEDDDSQIPPAAPDLASMNTTTTTTWGPPVLEERTLKRSGPCKTPVPEDKRTGKCSLDSNPNCERMQEKFVVIQSGIEDKRDEVQQQLDDLLASCKTTRLNIESQISDFEMQLQDQLTALAAATKKQNTAEEQSRLKSGELKMLVTDYDSMTTKCHTTYEILEGDECGLKKIRGELYKMKGQDHPAFFQDCVVSDWLAGDCSKSCGGGTLKLTRTIVTAPVGGAACPVMEEVKSCNEDKCPIDCVVSEYSEWSACTAKCGGGLQERVRDVLTEPEHGGTPCEELKQARSCNTASCDRDCELSDWDEWSPCSKACNSGTSERVRNINVPLQGDGTCPKIRDPERLQGRPCNSFKCQNALLSFKYFKFKPDKLRNNGKANSVQIADVSFLDINQVLSMNGWKAENPGGDNPGGEKPEKAVDENSGTKWLDFKKKELIVEAPNPVEVSHFRFITANDHDERDPVKWTLYGSEDKNKWEVLYKQTYQHDTPTSRYSGTKWFPLPTQPLRCASEVDVVLVLDGSGSLGKKGWEATVQAAEKIVESFMTGGKVNMAVLLYSREVEWVQHFDSDKKKTLKNIDAMKWPNKGTKTSLALNTAAAELALGRADATSVVVVVTDGKPQSPSKTKKAAEKLRKKARLMFVPVTKHAPLADIKEMASYPKEDNLVIVNKFEDLESANTIDTMVSNVCPMLY